MHQHVLPFRDECACHRKLKWKKFSRILWVDSFYANARE